MKTRVRLTAALLAVGALGLTACESIRGGRWRRGAAPAGSAPAPTPCELNQGSDITIEVVTHGQASDPFWSVVKRGVDDAAAASGATVSYSAPATFDMVQMSQLIDAAVAKSPDGLVVSVPDYDALKGSLDAATAAGIPIITINSGSDVFKEIGALTHIGQDETIAGRGAGARLAENGRNQRDVHQPRGRQRQPRRPVQRRQGSDGGGRWHARGAAGQPQRRRPAPSRRSARPSRRTRSIDAVLALGPTGAAPALAAVQQLGSDLQLATFDLSPDVLDAIEAGDDVLRHRPAAVPPGLPADRVHEAVSHAT